MENIFRHAEEGKDRVRAAREGTQEITFAALAATVAVIAIFIPVVFMEGIIGKFFLQFGVTLSVAVVLSYLEAITLAPARCAQLLKTSRHDRTWLGRVVDTGFERLAKGYGWLLTRNLRWPVLALVAAIALMVAAFQTLGSVPAEMVPSQDISRLMVRLQTAVRVVARGDRRGDQAGRGDPQRAARVSRVMFIVGGFGGGVNSVVAFVTLVPADQRPKTQQDIQQELRKELNALPGVRAVVQDLSQQGFSASRGFPIEFSVRGGDWETLVTSSLEIQEKLEASGVAVDIDSDYQLGVPELQIVPDRDLAADLRCRSRRSRPASTRWSAACASASTPRTAGASTCASSCWPGSARAPRTWPGCRCARATAISSRCPR